MSAHNPDVLAWLKKADTDARAISKLIVDAGDVPWEPACFHTHQAIEKALKALLVQRGQTPPKSHDLVVLINLCAPYEPSLVKFTTDCDALSKAYVATRYPAPVTIADQAMQKLVTTGLAIYKSVVEFITAAARQP